MLIGQRIGSYEVLAKLGEGGMGEVYRARDRKLQRDVALKVLLPAVANDPERLARFRREAQILASLNHPNIAHVYGLEGLDSQDDLEGRERRGGADEPFLVMELVDGPTLADRLARAAIPLDEALAIARQIGEALEAAHERGIIHRDLKPANIKIRNDGTAKVLDFGLAKALEPGIPSSASPALTNSPTLTSPALMTGTGILLGTAAYMSPEQARGKVADKRSDIWAFGVILFEMLAGRGLFAGATVVDTLASVLTSSVDLTSLPTAVPPHVRRLLRRCLAREPQNRISDAAVIRLELEDVDFEPVAVPSNRMTWLWVTVAALIASSLAVALWRRGGSVDATPAVTYRASLVSEAQVGFGTGIAPAQRMAISPDGRRLVTVAVSKDGHAQLWVRALDGLDMTPLAGTDGARAPFWSPDSRFVAFVSGNTLKKIELATGALSVLCEVPGTQSTGGAWNRDGTILFATNQGSIQKVDERGGRPAAAIALDPASGQAGQWYPSLLPDGRHFLYTGMGKANEALGVWIASLDDSTSRRLMDARSNVQLAGDWLFYLEATRLMAVRFDTGTLTIGGSPVPIADDIEIGGGSGRLGAFSVSPVGALVYQSRPGNGVGRLTWFDREGRQSGYLGDPGRYTDVELSRDGKRAAVAIQDVEGAPTRHIWLFDTDRGTKARLTFDQADARRAVFSPDGAYVVFNSSRNGRGDLFRASTKGAAEDQLIFKDDTNKTPESWSPDGRFVLFWSQTPSSSADLWAVPTSEPHTPFLVRRTPFGEGAPARFSPDGHSVAYWSDESGRSEVYVAQFQGTTERVQASSTGGDWPRWSADGRELFYLALDDWLMVVPVSREGQLLAFGMPRRLFQVHARNESGSATRYPYDVAPDGRILINALQETSRAETVTLLVNWPAALHQ